MDELVSDALIFVCEPCKAGKNLLCNKAGFGYFNLTATSRVSLK